MPAKRKYVLVKLKWVEKRRDEIVTAALISPSPVPSWQISYVGVQWTVGKSGESPGREMLWANRLKSGIECQIVASEVNCLWSDSTFAAFMDEVDRP
jgi:hypothetical protein